MLGREILRLGEKTKPGFERINFGNTPHPRVDRSGSVRSRSQRQNERPNAPLYIHDLIRIVEAYESILKLKLSISPCLFLLQNHRLVHPGIYCKVLSIALGLLLATDPLSTRVAIASALPMPPKFASTLLAQTMAESGFSRCSRSCRFTPWS